MATVPEVADCLRVVDADLLLALRVQPRASRSRIDGIEGGRLRLRVDAPPVEGSANRAVQEFLADLFDIARSRIVIERGEHGRNKQVRIAGGATQQVAIRDILAEAIAGKP
jgi:hypothetical protein